MDLTCPCFCLFSYGTIYRELERTILAANTQEDLKWFSNNHGPGMHMNWPAFEVRHRSLDPEHQSSVGSYPAVCLSSGIQPRPG